MLYDLTLWILHIAIIVIIIIGTIHLLCYLIRLTLRDLGQEKYMLTYVSALFKKYFRLEEMKKEDNQNGDETKD